MAEAQWVPDRTKLELIAEIHKWNFAAIELNLFLDTHWEDREALRYYNEAAENLQRAIKEYERRYGPLMAHGYATSEYPWAWIEEPWPWQIGM